MRVAILAAGLLALGAGAGCSGEEDPLATDPATALAPGEVERAYRVLESDELPGLLDELVARGDRRFIAPLIEVLHASQLGLLGGAHHNALVVTLERLTGQPLGADWFEWRAWYRTTSLRGPPGFADFKARLFGRIDPVLGEFVKASGGAAARTEELLWTGSGIDQPGALRSPPRSPAGECQLSPDEAVVGLAWNGAALAVPVRYLDWHELLNDRHAGIDYVLVRCALCGSVAAFEASDSEGTPRAFASSGLLLRSVRLMYDDATRTLWNELTGRAVFGPEAVAGARLRRLPVVWTTWGSWLEQHPGSSAIELPGGDERYGTGAPWGAYLVSAETVFPVGMERTELAPKMRVVGLESDAATKAWSLDALLTERVLHDEVDGSPLVLVATRGPVDVSGSDPRAGARGYTVGAEVRAYSAGAHRFRAAADPATLEAEDGTTWRVAEDVLHGPDGERLPRQLLTPSFWFAWQAFHPATEVWPPVE